MIFQLNRIPSIFQNSIMVNIYYLLARHIIYIERNNICFINENNLLLILSHQIMEIIADKRIPWEKI